MASSNQKPEQSADVNNGASLIQTAEAIFGGGLRRHTLDDGTVVEIRSAKMRQMKFIINFFSDLMNTFNDAQMKALVDLVSEKQMGAIVRGENYKDVEIDYNDLTGKAFNYKSVLHTILLSMADTIPSLITEFTTLPPEKYDDLDIDEGLLMVGGIFIVNYDFFIQRVAPMLASLMVAVGRKKGVIQSKPPENAQGSATAKPQSKTSKAKA